MAARSIDTWGLVSVTQWLTSVGDLSTAGFSLLQAEQFIPSPHGWGEAVSKVAEDG